MWRKLVPAAALLLIAASQDCVPRKSVGTGEDAGHYCVCNATYCDDAPSVTKQDSGSKYTLISSSQSGLRYSVSQGEYEDSQSEGPDGTITIDRSKKYQKIIGFGSSMTDSAGINIKSLSAEAANKLLKSYFGPGGSQYNLMRVPIAGTDFSTRPYSYTMKENDLTLDDFQLQPEDNELKIPLLKEIKNMSATEINLIASPWSASPWMKTVNTWGSAGKLRPELWHLWAEYMVKFFDAYKGEGIEFWAVTPQNEPTMYTFATIDINGMTWTAEEQRDWLKEHLVPTMKNSSYGDIKIFIYDDNRVSLFEWAKTVLQDKKVNEDVAGTAVHWYMDNVPPAVLDDVHQLFPDKILLSTEACIGATEETKVILGSWRRGEMYAKDIIENLSHWVTGWVDWNMALDMQGGPTWAGNYVDSPIIVNSQADEFYKQPMYYALGHFSKFIPPDSVRIDTTSQNMEKVQFVAFTTPDDGTVAVFLNTDTKEKVITVKDLNKGTANVTLQAKSINTMKYW